MLDRVITFTLLGFFVFSPTLSNWFDGLGGWYRAYLPWLFLTTLCILLHYDERRRVLRAAAAARANEPAAPSGRGRSTDHV